ncbi:MAG TPA: hypothetical protein ENJ56_08900, partial [Anaerolineae bacterium]|nr:hypothetical protein [Anaerolineae bacterium]
FMPLLMGAQVILASAATISQPDRLAHVLANYHVTMLQAPESIWQAFVASGWQGQADLTMLIADPTDTQLIKRLIPLGKAVYGCFGSAESGIISLLAPLQIDQPIALGRPIANTKAYVLDQQLNPLPIGATGQLFISGDGAAAGYFNQPTASQQRFMPNPFLSNGKQLQMVATGLSAKWLADGRIALSDQVAVTGENSATATPPAAFEFRPQPTQIILPMGRTEAVVADIWRAALDRETVDANADFFALGGHSLLALHILAQIKDKLGATLSLNTFLANPTVAALAKQIGNGSL